MASDLPTPDPDASSEMSAQGNDEHALDDADQWQRMHPSSLMFGALSRIGAFILPLVLVVFFGAGQTWEVWVGGFILLGIFFEAWVYFTLRYKLADRELIVRRGLIFKNERHVPYTRIQNIDLAQNPLHRMFNVATVRVETAGGSEPEAVLKVLSLDAVEEMRRHIFVPRRAAAAVINHADPDVHAKTVADDPQEEQHLLLALSTGELVRLGLTSVRGFAVVAVVMGLAWQFDVLNALTSRIREWLESLQKVGGVSIWFYIAAGLGALVIFMVLSIGWAIWKFHGFRLVRIGDDLRLTCGLFTRLSATVPRHRVQLVCIRETFVHRWMNRASVRIETASGGGSEEGEQARFSQKWIAPLVRREHLADLLREINEHAAVVGEQLDWQPLAPRARRRSIRKAILIVALCCALAAIVVDLWAIALLVVLLPLAIWHAVAAVRIAGYVRTGWGMMYRSGVLWRNTSLTMYSKMQVISAHNSPFDRRWNMARLQVDTAGAGPAEHSISIAYLEADVVDELRSDLAHAARSARWRI